jgi:YVTN family beta-propeller protein
MPAATSIGVVDTAPHLEAVTASGNNIYVMGFVSSKMTIINALTCATTTVPSIGGIIDASYYEGNIWAVGQNNDITEINPSTGATEESIDVHNQLRGVAYGGGYIYTVSRYGEPYIYKVDASTGKLVDTYEAPYSGMTDVIYENGYLWVADWYYNNVSEISASTGQVIRTVYAGPDPYGIAYGNGYIWVTSQKIREPGTVAQINPSTGEVIRSIPVGVLPINVTYGNGAVWVVNYESSGLTFTFGTVSEISGTTGKVLATISRYIGESPWGIIDHNGYVWVVNSYASYVTEIQG